MFNLYRDSQFLAYRKARDFFVRNPTILIDLEKEVADSLEKILSGNFQEIVSDYNEASFLYPFWQQYPPDDRGRKPRGDQYPWIEVGEHSIGDKLSRLLQHDFKIRDVGLPTGTDKRFILQNEKISNITNGFAGAVWLFVDIKSVGPRDDSDHAVMSHNQISGDGIWEDVSTGIQNSVMQAVGKREKHKFHCSIPPIYVLSDNTVAPVVLIVIKSVYDMLSLGDGQDGGQPLKKITVVTIPNGLLLEVNPGYLNMHPNLLFPGKDDKQKNPLKVRSRVSFEILHKIDSWRVKNLLVK